MNLFEVFDKETNQRTYYKAKKPLAVILMMLGLLSMCLCTPAGASFLESWLIEILPFGATPAAWIVAIGFDLTFAYILSQMFCDIFAGVDGRKTYWDIPTMLLVVLFGGITLCWSLWGGDMRKNRATKDFAAEQKTVLDSSFAAVAALGRVEGSTKSSKGIDRNERKSNEAIAALSASNLQHSKQLSKISDKQVANAARIEQSRHSIIENGKLIIIGAYLFLIVAIASVEYIKSKKDKTSQPEQEQEESTNIRTIVKKKTIQQEAKELRSKGKSYREIGAILEVTHTSARRYCQA